MYAFFPAAAALHPPLQCISPPSRCYLLLFAAYLGGRGDVTPLRAGTSRRVTDADVRRRQMQRRLMATLSLERVSKRVLQTDGEATELPSLLPTLTKKAVSLLLKSSGRLLSASVYRGVCSVCVGGLVARGVTHRD